ncbi:unnamed protein product, partial [Rotaria sp. Silwood1]
MCQILIFTIIFSNNYFCKTSPEQETLKNDSASPLAYIITVPGYDQRVPIVVATFKKYAGIDLRRFNGTLFSNESRTNGKFLSPGENGLRATMAKFFEMMVRDNPEQVLVFEDDAIPHLNFKVLFKELPSRCLEADLLLLGAGIWHSKHTQWPSGACFDADDATFGAYALLIKRICYGPILSWLQRETPRPYDHVYR